jgi:putative peptide zinc metalloprotease protein
MADALQTFSESWYRIASQRICLRPDVIVQRQIFRGERWIVLQNPFSNQFFRLRPAAYEFVARLRRERTVQEVWQECLDRFPDAAPGQEAVIQLLSQLYFANLLQYDAGSDTAQLFQRYERTRQRETRAKLLNVMFMRFPLLDPDSFLVRTLALARMVISPAGALVWLAVVGTAMKLVIDHWTLLKEQSQGVLAPSNLFLLYAGMVLVKTAHEFGHAYFCRRFGGEVHVMGIMLMIFTPMPYVDATSSWGFRSRWKRVLVGAAGMIVELFVAALATFVWANSGPGTLHSLAYNMIFVASVSTVIFNINPLLRYDGYYILSDLLEIPNLFQKSLAHLKHLAERYLFGITKSESPTPFLREKTWLTAYGLCSNVYRVVVFSGVLLFVADRFLLIGIIMAAVCAISWVCVPIIGFVKYLAASPALERHRPRAVAVSAAGFALLLVLLAVIPFPSHFRAPGVLRSREWTEVVNETAGRVDALLAPSGAQVVRNQPLLQLKNEPLELELAAARASYQEVEARLRQARSEDTASLKPLLSRLQAVEKRVRRLQRDQAALLIKARQDGVWVAPELKDFLGRWLVRGASLGLIVDPGGFEFTATVAQEDADSLFARRLSPAQARLFGETDKTLSLGPLIIVPAEQNRLPSPALGWAGGGEVRIARDDPQGLHTAEPFFEVRAPVTGSHGAALLHGRAGKIRFTLKPEPLLPRWFGRLRQLLQKRYQL